jgi:hypothetical protein
MSCIVYNTGIAGGSQNAIEEQASHPSVLKSDDCKKSIYFKNVKPKELVGRPMLWIACSEMERYPGACGWHAPIFQSDIQCPTADVLIW